MKKSISADLLKKYLEGRCSEDEEILVNDWYSSFEGKTSDEYSFIPEGLEEKMLDSIKNRILPTPRTSQETKKSTSRLLLVAATVSIIIVSAGWMAYRFSFEKHVPTTPQPMAQVRNSGKAIQRVLLEDGSVVWLKPHSEITYERAFSGPQRRLKLVGEAFFHIHRDTDHPFVISTNNVETQVLGTSFSIKAYEESSSIEVEVLTGKVSVKLADRVDLRATQEVLLAPNEKATYFKVENQLRKSEPERPDDLAIWKPSDISFDNVPVREVIHALNAAFAVKIQASNVNLLNCLVRADFSDQNLPDILELLSKSIEASYEFRDNTFYLMGEGCAK